MPILCGDLDPRSRHPTHTQVRSQIINNYLVPYSINGNGVIEMAMQSVTYFVCKCNANDSPNYKVANLSYSFWTDRPRQIRNVTK